VIFTMGNAYSPVSKFFPIFTVMNTRILLLFLLLPALPISCCKDSGAGDPLTGCCGTPGIDAQVGNGHVFLANIITPNADGINDLLWPSADFLILQINRMRVRDNQGHLVFEALNESPNNISVGWDGTIDGVIKKGVYDIELEVEAADGTVATLEGKVCNYPCRESNEDKPIQTGGCQFPAQVNDGHYDPTIASLENSDCFE
jgi:CHU_C Type IX secretion signal domain